MNNPSPSPGHLRELGIPAFSLVHLEHAPWRPCDCWDSLFHLEHCKSPLGANGVNIYVRTCYLYLYTARIKYVFHRGAPI